MISQGWLYGWQKNNFIRNGDEIPNADLWRRVYELLKKHKVTLNKVAGHSDNEYNNRCDRLAVGVIKENRTI